MTTYKTWCGYFSQTANPKGVSHFYQSYKENKMTSIRDLPYTKNIEDCAIEVVLPFVNRAMIDDNPTLLKIAGEYCFLHPEKFNDPSSDLSKAQTIIRMSMIALKSGWRNFGDCNDWKNYNGWLSQMKLSD